MTKRRDILRAILTEAKAQGFTTELSEGGNHSILVIDGLKVPIPRHNEIRENTARSIYKDAGAKLGPDWWK